MCFFIIAFLFSGPLLLVSVNFLLGCSSIGEKKISLLQLNSHLCCFDWFSFLTPKKKKKCHNNSF